MRKDSSYRSAMAWRCCRRPWAADVHGRRSRSRTTTATSPWNFRNHVEAVLTKQGCNSGACHGAAAGKNGFRLTLRGYGPEVDHAVLTRQALGRRVIKTAPQESLLLLKPTGAIEHGGGVKFTTGSLEYQVIAEWIAAGMPGPSAGIREIRSLDASTRRPSGSSPGQVQQVLVQATYSDGRVEDVTRWAKFSSTDETVAAVDDDGRLKVTGRGEAFVSVWFASRVGRMTVTSPYETKLDPSVFATAPRNNPIDDKNLAKLAEPADSAVAGRGRCGVPAPGQPRRDRHAAPHRRSQSVPRRSRPGQASEAHRRDCSRAPSSSITGPTDGRTCSWSRRKS